MGADAAVLVIDDESDLLDLMVETLNDSGYLAIPAVGAQEATAALDAMRFQVVVSDVMMPEVSGLDLLDAVKRRFQETEVVLVTGYATPDTVALAWEKGASGFLLKPFSTEQLVDAVGRALERVELRLQSWPVTPPLRSGRVSPGATRGLAPDSRESR